MNRILIIAAHPDDEVISIGASIKKWTSDGKKVGVLFLSDGETSRPFGEEKICNRKSQANEALNILGATCMGFGGFPDNMLDTVPLLGLAKLVENVIKQFQPDTVFTHSSSDLNIDHKMANQAALIAVRPIPNQIVKCIGVFETMSATGWDFGTQFQPNYYVQIDERDWSAKREALECYKDELRDFPHARSIAALEALAIYRGASVGTEKAEALQLIRVVEVLPSV